ncbi:MAG: nucleotidyltransferase family protein [Acidobacteria bacterium]|nr:nucleotidyltransferase family protein [Acidobacteriota bacterium]
MKLTSRSSLAEVAAYVAKALARAKIRAVLTGGACATIYSKGEYQSLDLDFVLQSAISPEQLDAVMESIGFRATGNRYEHPHTPFFVEFPAGPLGIGADIDIRPVFTRIKGVGVRVLSATDSCRDRLAAFYHWNDRQSLITAVQVAKHRKVNLNAIRAWSGRENASDKFMEFLGILRQAQKKPSRPGKRRV